MTYSSFSWLQSSVLKQRPLCTLAGRWCWIMLLIVSTGEMLLSMIQSNFTLIGRSILMLNTLWFLRQSPATLSYFLFPAFTTQLLNNTLMDTDRWLSLAILLHLKLCLQLGGNVGWSDWPEWTSCYTAGEHQCGSCPSHWIASALTASAPTVRFLRGGVDKRSRSAGRMGSVCVVCTSLISPQRDSDHSTFPNKNNKSSIQ